MTWHQHTHMCKHQILCAKPAQTMLIEFKTLFVSIRLCRGSSGFKEKCS